MTHPIVVVNKNKIDENTLRILLLIFQCNVIKFIAIRCGELICRDTPYSDYFFHMLDSFRFTCKLFPQAKKEQVTANN